MLEAARCVLHFHGDRSTGHESAVTAGMEPSAGQGLAHCVEIAPKSVTIVDASGQR
jgi:hypothetical protein